MITISSVVAEDIATFLLQEAVDEEVMALLAFDDDSVDWLEGSENVRTHRKKARRMLKYANVLSERELKWRDDVVVPAQNRLYNA